MPWLCMAGAIVAEVIGTLSLRGVSTSIRPLPVILLVVFYPLSFLLMAVALRSLNVGMVYAIWSGFGTAAVAGAAVVIYGERLNIPAVIGMALIVVGTSVLATSGATHHE